MIPSRRTPFSRDRRARFTARAATSVDDAPAEKLLADRRQKLPAAEGATILDLDQHQTTRIVSDALREEYGDQRKGIARLAEDAGTTVPAARNWVEGRNLPAGLQLLRLIATCPPLQAEVRRLCAMEADLDPRLERSLHETMQLFQAITGGKVPGDGGSDGQ